MKAYFDGSGSAQTSNIVVLAGVAAEESVWDEFEVGWNKVLADRSPHAPYVHMKELIHGHKAFKDSNGWNEAKRSKLVWDCMLYAQYLDKKKFRTFVCVLDMQHHRAISEGLSPKQLNHFPSYITICNKYVPLQVFKWYLEDFNNREEVGLQYFFDQGEKFCGPFEALWKRKKKQSRGGLFNHWETIKQVTPRDMREVPQLQLADLIAWSWHRAANPHKDNLPWAQFHQITTSVLPHTRKEVGREELDFTLSWITHPLMLKEYFENLNPDLNY